MGIWGSAQGVCVRARVCAQIVRELHTCVWGCKWGVGVHVVRGSNMWGPCGTL